jgi:hypothetical protein
MTHSWYLRWLFWIIGAALSFLILQTWAFFDKDAGSPTLSQFTWWKLDETARTVLFAFLIWLAIHLRFKIL